MTVQNVVEKCNLYMGISIYTIKKGKYKLLDVGEPLEILAASKHLKKEVKQIGYNANGCLSLVV